MCGCSLEESPYLSIHSISHVNIVAQITFRPIIKVFVLLMFFCYGKAPRFCPNNIKQSETFNQHLFDCKSRVSVECKMLQTWRFFLPIQTRGQWALHNTHQHTSFFTTKTTFFGWNVKCSGSLVVKALSHFLPPTASQLNPTRVPAFGIEIRKSSTLKPDMIALTGPSGSACMPTYSQWLGNGSRY